MRSLLEQLNHWPGGPEVVDRARFLVALVPTTGRDGAAPTRSRAGDRPARHDRRCARSAIYDKAARVPNKRSSRWPNCARRDRGACWDQVLERLTSRVGRSRASEGVPAEGLRLDRPTGPRRRADALIGVLQRSAPGRTSRSISRWTIEVPGVPRLLRRPDAVARRGRGKAFAEDPRIPIFNAVLSMFWCRDRRVSANTAVAQGPSSPRNNLSPSLRSLKRLRR